MSEKKKEIKYYAYFITWNNYEEDSYDYVKQYIENNCKYGLLCKEIAPTTGTRHLHFYLNFKSEKAFNVMKKKFPKANVQKANGTAQDNYIYISKTDKDFYEYGEKPQQGKRNDITRIITSVQSGENMRQIIPQSTSLQSIKVAEICMKYFEQKRHFQSRIYWFYGKTGTGKTKHAWEMFPNAYEKRSDIKWWDGYDAHEDVIIDDFRPHHINFVELIKILHEHPYKCEIKGGFRQLLAKNIIITAPIHPEEMYKNALHDFGEDPIQLYRRIHTIQHFE